MSILEFRNVTIAYDSVFAVEDVSFEVREGDFFCVVGANGSGKSSLIRGALGLLPLHSGTIKTDVDARSISYVPQIEAAERDFPATAREIVLTGTQKKGRRFPFYTAADRREADAVMRLFGIEELAGMQIGKLSGGQQQRVMLARAMCRNPSLLFLDEPCAGLDAESKAVFYTTLKELNRVRNMSIVMVSHDLEDVEKCATRVAELAQRLIFLGNSAEWTHTRTKKQALYDRGVVE